MIELIISIFFFIKIFYLFNFSVDCMEKENFFNFYFKIFEAIRFLFFFIPKDFL